MDVTIQSTSDAQTFANHHLTPDSFLNANPNPAVEGMPHSSNPETPAKRRPGRPKGSGKKDSTTSTTPQSVPGAKRPVGRPRKDGLPAGSAGPSRPRKSANSDNIPDLPTSLSVVRTSSVLTWRISHYHMDPQNHNLYSNGTNDASTSQPQNHAGPSSSNNFSPDHDWAELAWCKPSMFLTALLISLTSMPSVPATSTLTVEEAFKSHLVSLAPSPSQNHHIPSLYSILKTFWLPSSPAYFALTASTSTARTPSDHRFLYWDPQPLVFNGISCPNCSSPLLNQGRIKSGPIKIYDIERPFFVIGCEYVCKSATCVTSKNSEGRKYASTDPSILRSLPTKLKDEFPARLIHETDSGSGPDVWNWTAAGVSKLLWNLVRGALKAGLKKEGIIDLLWNVQRGHPGEEEKKVEEHEDASQSGNMVNGNGYTNGTINKSVQQGSEGFTDAYNNAWKANTAVVGARDSISSTVSSATEVPPIVPSSTPSTGPSSASQNPTPVFTQPSYTPTVYPHPSNPNFTSYQFTHQDFASPNNVSPKMHPSSASVAHPSPSTIPILTPTLVSSSPGTPTPLPPNPAPVNTSAHLPNMNGNGTAAPSELGTKRSYPFGPASLGDTSQDFNVSQGPTSHLSLMTGEAPRKRSPRHCSNTKNEILRSGAYNGRNLHIKLPAGIIVFEFSTLPPPRDGRQQDHCAHPELLVWSFSYSNTQIDSPLSRRGLKYVSKNRRQRIEAIASELAASEEYDIIALQEIWVYADYEHVRDKIAQRLPHSKFFYSGALGSGLAIFSRFPIVGSTATPYSLNGQPIDVAGGDWFVGKAAVSVVLQHPILGQVQVFNTHFYAKGGEDGPEYYRAHRLVNAWEFAKQVKQAASMGRYIIALGDYNSIPTSLPMAIIREYTDVSDSWLVTHPYGNPPPDSRPTAEEAIEQYGVTADSPLCSWSAGKPLGGHALQFGGKRLDYVFYRPPMNFHNAEKRLPTLRATDCSVTLRHNIPGTGMSFSDHFALRATLEIENVQGSAESSTAAAPSPFDSPTFHAHESSQDAWSDEPTELSPESIATTIQALATCYSVSKQRGTRELYIFGLCIFLLVAIIVGSAFFPHAWISPIFVIVTIALSWLGTTMLYEGFLYSNWERNALMNVIEELEIYKNALEIQSGRRSS
ncbi:hypothetical protein VNI00_002158 [Paramarasmius palmivorus]|uniref:Endonuclease/exonuclease/phosphatase domain-containing protein n=1 Tax=Paramarasmius palmivorus TaxID=297713 RepID=A0AAW0E3X3_9AGAR